MNIDFDLIDIQNKTLKKKEFNFNDSIYVQLCNKIMVFISIGTF
jgi:hypothetical protein